MEETEKTRTPAEEDARVEAAVLRQLLALHPIQLGLGELLRELGIEAEDFEQRDAVERAVRELTGAGLTRRSGELVLPTRAALRLDQLLD